MMHSGRAECEGVGFVWAKGKIDIKYGELREVP